MNKLAAVEALPTGKHRSMIRNAARMVYLECFECHALSLGHESIQKLGCPLKVCASRRRCLQHRVGLLVCMSSAVRVARHECGPLTCCCFSASLHLRKCDPSTAWSQAYNHKCTPNAKQTPYITHGTDRGSDSPERPRKRHWRPLDSPPCWGAAPRHPQRAPGAPVAETRGPALTPV